MAITDIQSPIAPDGAGMAAPVQPQYSQDDVNNAIGSYLNRGYTLEQIAQVAPTTGIMADQLNQAIGAYRAPAAQQPMTTQTGGLNPGYMKPTPFYQTTSPVQSKFFWGPHGYQGGTTFNAQAYNEAFAPQSPWGLQQMAEPLSYEELRAVTQGLPFERQILPPAQRVAAYNPESMAQGPAYGQVNLPSLGAPTLGGVAPRTMTPIAPEDLSPEVNASNYFAANPDVKEAYETEARAKGMTPEQYADFHWNNFGRTEGRRGYVERPIVPEVISA